VIDDYGHHPTEIRATLAAARHCGFKRVHVIFQPHRFTRTRDLLEQFGAAFNDADTVSVLDVYAASEAPLPGITGERVAQAIQLFGDQRGAVSYVASFGEAARQVSALAEPGDMVLTLGAGSVSQLGPMVLEQLRKKQAQMKEAASY
jgi:UDP-N-acetylmuramate--alanine ligase